MIISQMSEVTFCKRIHSKWKQIMSHIKKDGSVSYVTNPIKCKRGQSDSAAGRPFTSGGLTWSYRLRNEIVRQHKDCADKTSVHLEIKLIYKSTR